MSDGSIRTAFATLIFAAISLLASASTRAQTKEVVRVPAGEIGESTTWSGGYLVSAPVSVPAGVRLSIAAGTIVVFEGAEAALAVAGEVVAEGSEREPILLTNRLEPGAHSWAGMTVAKGGKVRLSRCDMRGAMTAVGVVGAEARLSDCRFERNGTALALSMEAVADIERCFFRENRIGASAQLRARLTVRESSFSGNAESGIILQSSSGGKVSLSEFTGQTGLVVKQGADVFLEKNRFHSGGLGIALDQVGPDVRLSGNSFEGLQMGIRCLNFSVPWIACSRFTSCDTGLLAERFSNPLVTQNLFQGNQKGVAAVQKSSFPIRKNIFSGNKDAVYMELSSYPVISGNNFLENARDIVLGATMSADWEKRVGSGNITRENARQTGTHNMEGVERQLEYSGVVDARANWWGEATTAQMEKAGPDGNITAIQDGHDTPRIEYPGYGDGSYLLDIVAFSPWEKGEVKDAGPLPGGCGDFTPPAAAP